MINDQYKLDIVDQLVNCKTIKCNYVHYFMIIKCQYLEKIKIISFNFFFIMEFTSWKYLIPFKSYTYKLKAYMICVCVITTITIKIIPLRIDTKKYRLRHSVFSSILTKITHTFVCFRDVSFTLRFGHSTFRPQTISAIVVSAIVYI
jgi:hypothetical protein